MLYISIIQVNDPKFSVKLLRLVWANSVDTDQNQTALEGTVCSGSIHVISFKGASGRFSFHFREVYEKCIEYIRNSSLR